MMKGRRKRRIDETLTKAQEAGLTPIDLGLLRQLLEAGASMQAPRLVNYYLYLPTEEAALLAANDARHADFDAHTRPPLSEYPDQWMMVATRIGCILDIEVIKANSRFFAAIADTYRGDYDGWQATAD